MKNVLIGCGQITWRNVPEDQVLSEIAQAGYAGAPAAPSKGQSTAETLALFQKHNLKPAPGYLGAEYWDKNQEAQILARAKELAAFAKAAGCTNRWRTAYIHLFNADGHTCYAIEFGNDKFARQQALVNHFDFVVFPKHSSHSSSS